MGQRYEFCCESCGYTAEVSGDIDSGDRYGTTTIVCHDCQELYDVTVADFHVSGIEPKAFPARCPKDPSHRIEEWTYPGQCPRCGGQMTQGDMVCLWD